MTPLAFLLIITSAGLHASWNMIAKKSRMTVAFYAVLVSIGALWSSCIVFASPLHFFAMPQRFYLALAGMLAGELVYGTGLVLAYRTVDMSTAYPMMRSIPLLLIAGITALFGLGKPLTTPAMCGMAVLFAGCLLMPLPRLSDLKLRNYLNSGMLYIVLVACGTTAYTIFDSMSLDAIKNAFPDVSATTRSLTYYSFRATSLAVAFWLIALCFPGSRAETAEFFRRRSWMPICAGVCSSLTYVLVLIAMNFVTNVAYVQAFRQLGLLIGMLEGVFILKERCTVPKVVGITLILAGLAMTLL